MKINQKIKELVETALKDKSGYQFIVEVGQNNDCTKLECHIIAPCPGDVEDFWLYTSTEEITRIIQKATNMIWEAPATPGRDRWTLKKGCIHWGYSTGIPGGDGTDVRGMMEDEIDEFLVFQDGEFQDKMGFVNGVRDDSVDISSSIEEWEFCEEVCV